MKKPPANLICTSCSTIYHKVRIVGDSDGDTFVEYTARRYLSINMVCIEDVLRMRGLKVFSKAKLLKGFIR